MKRLVLLCAAVLSTIAPAAARVLDLPDLRKIITFSSPRLSPDGRTVVYLRTHIEWEKDRWQTDLMLLDLHTHHIRRLTYDRRGLDSPRWSPDGTRLAFLADAQTGTDQESQIFVLPMGGGEARQITHAERGVQRFVWGPDGRRFAYVTQDENPRKRQVAAHDDAFEVGDNDYLKTQAPIPSHLWMVGEDGKNATRLTRGTFSLSTIELNVGTELSWSSDGRSIAFSRLPNAILGDARPGTVWLYDLRERRMHKLTSHTANEGGAWFAPIGNRIAYAYADGGDATNGTGIMVTAPSNGDGRQIRTGFDRNIDDAVWLPTADGMLLSAIDGTQRGYWLQRFGSVAKRLALGAISPAEMGNFAHNGSFVFVASRANHPGELFLLPSLRTAPVRLTDDNAFMDHIQTAAAASVSWKTTKGNFQPDGMLFYPPGYVKGRRYPLILYVHGGPHEAVTRSWNSRAQYFSSRGYVVFCPNYRGSTNLGDAFEHAISHDAGDGPGKDVMSGVALLEQMGVVDPGRIAVSGWSYGGYMTFWLESHYHIWKAAFAGAGLSDNFDDYNISFWNKLDVPWFGGGPWDPKAAEMWRNQSPIEYAFDITTPTLMVHDVGDPNVTVTNSYKMYHALKDRGVPVEFIVIPVHGHFPGDPVRTEDVNKTWLAWLDKYLK